MTDAERELLARRLVQVGWAFMGAAIFGSALGGKPLIGLPFGVLLLVRLVQLNDWFDDRLARRWLAGTIATASAGLVLAVVYLYDDLMSPTGVAFHTLGILGPLAYAAALARWCDVAGWTSIASAWRRARAEGLIAVSVFAAVGVGSLVIDSPVWFVLAVGASVLDLVCLFGMSQASLSMIHALAEQRPVSRSDHPRV